jgi:hypothetical protein
MSFRLFIFYCAVCGAWAALIGCALSWWALSLQAEEEWQREMEMGVKAMCLGLSVALALGIVDTLWNFSLRQVGQLFLRVVVVVVVGAAGGFTGGYFGQELYQKQQQPVFLLLVWVVTGLLIGAAIGTYDFLVCLLLGRNQRGARRKLLNGVFGGTAGGVLGGLLYVFLSDEWRDLFRAKGEDARLWSPSALGFVVLGACIGLLIGLAQVILKEAWVKVEAGFRRGRELILSKPETTIGRAEACDIGLFGDPGVDRLHARIVQQGGRYLLADAGTVGGTYLNDQRIVQPTPLRSGDAIRLGNCLLRFGERRKGK